MLNTFTAELRSCVWSRCAAARQGAKSMPLASNRKRSRAQTEIRQLRSRHVTAVQTSVHCPLLRVTLPCSHRRVDVVHLRLFSLRLLLCAGLLDNSLSLSLTASNSSSSSSSSLSALVTATVAAALFMPFACTLLSSQARLLCLTLLFLSTLLGWRTPTRLTSIVCFVSVSASPLSASLQDTHFVHPLQLH